ncbi:amino acid adenylation domain-containing protein [Actinoplanes sp. TRM 88003]|uniref:Amino acid adenylation domain-containing protein n=1 Tax=Paractinoplanes aksuensis TaxID=2939490 RepID=A0ABT1DSU2_9ACTN|nr:non-ribosomal peptide synthetase [Actinoplanes aksuensis]MCO8273919.1 amino acid adenylation domain-containing protein [Actinoplanes aksuensis]
MNAPSPQHRPDETTLIADLVARRAAATPDAVAVLDGHEMTYADLDARAGHLGRHLHSLGAGPQSPVGICLRRGADLVVGLLAVWRAGAAYVPFDPDEPPARLGRLIAGAGVGHVLTSDDLLPVVRAAGGDPVVAGDAGPGAAPGWSAGPLDPDDAAYVIHTSGSTGTPKGVVVTHAGIANRVAWTVREHELGARDRVLFKTALTFDASCWEVFAPLVSGGAVVPAPVGAERDPAALLDAVGRYGATVLQVVPSVLRQLVDAPGWESCTSLRLLFSAGEPLHAELAWQVLERVKVEIWNTYGPTECAIDTTAYRFDTSQRSGPVPIGRPITGMRVLVLDPETGAPVGAGEPGELYAGGVGVARGYLGRPDLTAERFVPDPGGPGRLYRTGDQVRRRADGVLEYLGRLDSQLKVNGVRIEAGEVEAALRQHPRVRAAVVHGYRAEGGETRLAAYVRADNADVTGELRAFLADRLPQSHLPAAYVALDEFPLTTSGKLDRAALPVPGAENAGTARPTPPQTEAQLLVAGAWRAILKLDEVALEDDFFALGGSSLQLTRLANQLRKASGRDVKLRGLLNATTLAAQAELIEPEPADPDVITAVPRDGVLPLSSGQHRLWFAEQMTPGTGEWISAVLLPVPGEATDDAVRAALTALVARHEALRTRFPLVDGAPAQVVAAPAAVPLPVAATTKDGLTPLLREQFGQTFDLAAGPLYRALLVRVDGGRDLVALTVHHIVCDGWSSTVLEREFAALLAAGDAALPALPVQYADFAAWQRGRLTDEALAPELAHWRAALDGLEPLDLPTDHARPATRDGRGSVVPFVVPAPVATALTDLGRAHGATPFMTLLTAYATLLARHTGQWDVAVGSPVSGRHRPEVENVVGFFLNSLVLRCGLDPAWTFAQALDRVRDAGRAAFAHQDVPFERLVEELAPERDLSRTPLYQAAFDMHDAELTGSAVDVVDADTLRDTWRVAHTDLTLFLRARADGSLDGGLEYAESLFDRATVERLTGHLQRLLAAVAADPGVTLGAAELLTGPERALLLGEWAHGPAQPAGPCTHELIAARAAADPDAVAVVTTDGRLSYGELDRTANRLAHHLRAHGAGAGAVVGVLLERGPSLLVSLLAVWKAGAAYLPLDPATPPARAAELLAASGAVALIAAGSPVEFAGPVIDPRAVTTGPDTAPEGAADPDGLAYVIYTSGSTGRPKGVMVPHRGVANHLRWAADELVAAGPGGSAVFSSVAFDLVVPNVWAPLLVGERVVLLPADLDLSELGARLVEAGPFSFLKLTPGHLEVLVQQITAEQTAGLAGVVVAAGEALSGGLAARWTGPLINEYGPTEASVGTCTHVVPAEPGAGVVPIGRPLPGMTMYVLDVAMRPVPVGAVGELYVGGAGVARGYLGRPGLTGASFVPDPYGTTPGARLYRTGDRVRWLAEGAVQFLGRVDEQVKIRGYRVEPGEARAVLVTHPAIREAAVVAVGEGSSRRLAAYYVSEADLDRAELTGFCAGRLPDYLIPGTFTRLDALPLNANGKLDRRRLPAPEPVGAVLDDAPGTEAEQLIAGIFQELLGAPAGAHENFFHAGGNSILAIRLIAEIQREFAVTLPVRTVFEGPTPAALAAAVEDAVRAEIAAMTENELSGHATPLGDQTGPEGLHA